MLRALGLAQKSIGHAHPNPNVGAVMVKNGRVIAEGFHDYDRLDHAEIVALRKAGERARGAALYVNLEPCCTSGRTGPCTKAIVAAGVKRVVAAMADPNPAVAGRGLAELRRAGIRVDVGLRENEGRRLNEDFACWIRTGFPLVTLKSALTLDGQIAASRGSVTWITSGTSRAEVQRMRHAADAILTGIGTVLEDDPRLTDRTGLPRRRKLLRAVVDSRLRLPLRSKLVRSADGDVIVFTTQSADLPKARALQRAGVEIVRVASWRGRVNLREAVRELGRRQMLNVLLEAGAQLNGAALEAGIVDKMVLFYAPKILGGDGVPMTRVSSGWFPKPPALTNLSFRMSGPDFVVQGYFHNVYRHHRSRRKN